MLAFLFLVFLPIESWKHQTLIREWIQRGVKDSNPLTLSRPNSTLEWTACPDNSTFYSPDNNDAENTVTLAMRVFPATVSAGDRLGSIFMNPGGPGGSGHASLLRTGPLLSGIFEGKYDIVSWDPRGVNMSTPVLSCFPTELHRALFALGEDASQWPDNDDRTLLKRSLLLADARSKLLISLCRQSLSDEVLRSVTTVNVVRDMDEMRKAIGDGGMRYWGFSYGTLVGATYVAMFPETAERVILDGVIYAPESYNSMLIDGVRSGASVNQEFEQFVSLCAEAGPSRCALAANNASASDISTRIWALATRLSASPLPLPNPPTGALPTLIHQRHLMSAIFTSFYKPNTWTKLAEAVAAAENDDGTLLAELSGAGGRNWQDLRRNITDVERAEERGWGGQHIGNDDELGMGVLCGDAPPFVVEEGEGEGDEWTEEWMRWRDQLVEPNRLNGPMWFSMMMVCRHWARVQPTPERYDGPWKIGVDLRRPKFPVAFVSNSFDPITPINNAVRMVDLLGVENARLLHNNAYGHCSTNHPSLCVAKHIRAFMTDGIVFENGTLCEPEPGFVFPDPGSDPKERVAELQIYSEEDKKLVETLRQLAEAGLGHPYLR
ncbi:AB hydrolase-1 domain-containing protein [Mycena chlorophos]|uniref:AB hydrolase-1 domain-containing protein n=1 Tax=Mycena chlorophos TaxID=658473 RepID=A0A8H6SA48_MYCCL|nr:AB hydrolase-1 domain-containing protein [Mycena chlorophos]